MTPTELISHLHLNYIYHLQHDHAGVDLDSLLGVLNNRVACFNNPNTVRFCNAYNHLPDLPATGVSVVDGVVRFGGGRHSEAILSQLNQALEGLKPWRKGPLDFGGIHIDAEWRSDLKWQRLHGVLPSLEDRNILDIGCNNGYYMFRMLDQKPHCVLGIDPAQLCAIQFAAMQKYAQSDRLHYALMGVEDLPVFTRYFDVVFCMGVLYHNRSPIDVLTMIRNSMRRKGTLVLETIMVPGEESTAFFPEQRYAKMRNVYFFPTETCLHHWLGRAGFRNIRTISKEATTSQEQRSTRWVEFQTLDDFLDPDDPTRTVEGYPAPVRITVLADLP